MSSESNPKSEFTVQGISASQGIAYGPAFLYVRSEIEVPCYEIARENYESEISRFEQALVTTRQQIQKTQAMVEKNLGPDEARIFDAHLLVLEDQALIVETIRDFNRTSNNIESCFNRVAQRYIKAFAEIDDEYLRERASDIRDVMQRMLNTLLGRTSQTLSQLVEKRIVVASDVSPSDAAGIDRSQALGIVTDTGSKTSHAVIVARSMRVPAVVGTRDLTSRVKNGDIILVDGYEGTIIVNPSEATLFRYGQIQIKKKGYEQRLMEEVGLPSETLDGVKVPLRANIEKSDEAQLVREFHGDGVGLYRSEFLYLHSNSVPSEEEQYAAYRKVVDDLAPAPVTIRTMDLGGDKLMAIGGSSSPREENPFLGYRAIRLCLDNVDMFKAQLRAILRASAHGHVNIMYPMISGRDELRQANAILDECKRELRTQGVAFDEAIRTGSMIEIPSAAVTADLLARECDFFSIGTNDLIQYLIAIDRLNDRTAHLYEPTHPAVLRTLRQIVDAAHAEKIKVSVCGEMAGDPVLAVLLIGLGVDDLSMTPPLLPAVKKIVRSMRMADARRLAYEALQMESSSAIYQRCVEFHRERIGE